MKGMFVNAQRFDGDISKWGVSRVTNMVIMFLDEIFNDNISKWNVSRVKNMESMLSGTAAFSGDISKWDVLVDV